MERHEDSTSNSTTEEITQDPGSKRNLEQKLWPYVYLSDIAKFKVRHDDVFLLSYLKSGTSWTANIISLIMGWEGKADSRHLFDNVLHLEMTQGYIISKAANTPGMYELANDRPSPRVLKTHLRLEFLPRDIESKRPKIVYVARNPKDAVVSYFNFTRMTNNITTCDDWPSFLNKFYQEKSPNRGWFDHVITFWRYREDHENILYLKYEDMHKNLRDAVTKIADFLERPLSDDTIDSIVSRSTFNAMKNNPTMNPDQKIPSYTKGIKENRSFMRKGKVGDWKNYFTVAQSETFDAYYKERMKGLDLTFDFTL